MEKPDTDLNVKAGIVPFRGDAVYCQDCGWTGEEADCNPIQDIYQRVAPGEPMPAGERPKCGALCQLKSDVKSRK